jgi:predicted nucleic acid-binding protein
VPAAKALLVEHMEGKAKIIVPPLLYYEVGNILLFGRSRPPGEEAIDALSDLFSIPLEVVAPTLIGAHTALRLASVCRLSYYDATYLTLAEMLACPLITADKRLAQRARTTGHVRLLGTAA